MPMPEISISLCRVMRDLIDSTTMLVGLSSKRRPLSEKYVIYSMVTHSCSIVKQLDWRIALPACIMFFALQLDRGNIVQAVADNMLGWFELFLRLSANLKQMICT